MVANRLIESEDQEAATHRLLEAIQADDLQRAGLLRILLYELKALREERLLDHMVEVSGIGLVDLSSYNLSEGFNREIDLELCWATWTIPFDTVEDVHFVSTAYYLSDPVVKHWVELLPGRVIWFASPMASIIESLEQLSAEVSDLSARKPPA